MHVIIVSIEVIGIFFGDVLGDDLVNNGVADDVGKDQCDYDGTDDGNGSELGCDHACKGSADNGDKGSNLDSELVGELGDDNNSRGEAHTCYNQGAVDFVLRGVGVNAGDNYIGNHGEQDDALGGELGGERGDELGELSDDRGEPGSVGGSHLVFLNTNG